MTSKRFWTIAAAFALWTGVALAQENAELQKLLDQCARGDARALNPLRRFGPAAAPAVPSIIAIMKNHPLDAGAPMEVFGVQNDAVDTLGRIGPAAKPAIPLVLAFMEMAPKLPLQSPNPALDAEIWGRLRMVPLIVASETLGAMGPGADAALPKLKELTMYPDPAVALAAHVGLAGITGDPKELDAIAAALKKGEDQTLFAMDAAVENPNLHLNFSNERIKEFMADPNPHVSAIGQGLAKLNMSKSDELAPSLVLGFTHNDSSIARKSREALAALGAEAVPALIAGLKGQFDTSGIPPNSIESAKHAVLAESALTLAMIGPKGQAAAPVLIPMLKDKNMPRYAILQALAEMGDAAKPAIPDIQAILASDAHLAIWARYALYRFDVDREAQLQAIVNAVGFTGYDLTPRDVLQKIGPVAIPVLMARFDAVKEKSEAADQVVKALASFKTEAKPALPMLQEYMKATANDKGANVEYIRGRVKEGIFQIESAIEEERKHTSARPNQPDAPAPPAEKPSASSATPTSPVQGHIVPTEPVGLKDLPPVVSDLVKADFPNDAMTAASVNKTPGNAAYKVVLHSPGGTDRAMEINLTPQGEAASTKVALLQEEIPQTVLDGAKAGSDGGDLRPTLAKTVNTAPAVSFMATRTVTYVLNGKRLDKPTVLYVVMLKKGAIPGNISVDAEGKVVTPAKYLPPRKPATPAPRSGAPQQP